LHHKFPIKESHLRPLVTSVALALIVCFPVRAQDLNENFSGTAFPPPGWTSFRGANGIGTLYDWTRVDFPSQPISGPGSAYVRYEANGGIPGQDWLVTPLLRPSAGHNVLSFLIRDELVSPFALDYKSTLMIMVSTASQTTHADFIPIDTLPEPNTSSFTLQTVNLSAYDNQDIYVAFVMQNDDGDGWFIDEVTGISFPPPTPMAYQSVATVQGNTAAVIRGATNQDVISVLVTTTGTTSPLVVSQLVVHMAGTTNVSDVVNARIFYTGTGTFFGTAKQFGATAISPNGVLTFSDSLQLQSGVNHFWLAFDIKGSATVGHEVDGGCVSVTVNGVGTVVPSVTSPAGRRPIWDTNFGGGAAGGGYLYSNSTSGSTNAAVQPAYNWISEKTNEVYSWTSGNDDDGYFGPISLPFNFPFFGSSYSQVYISSNGFLSFGAGSKNRFHTVVPSPGPPNGYIAGAWKDLTCSQFDYADAHVYYGTNGNKFIATYVHAHDYNVPASYITFQIILSPNGDVKIQYNPHETSSPLPGSIINDCTVGIEGPSGTKGINYRFNGSGGPMFNDSVAIAFMLDDAPLPIQLASFTGRLDPASHGVLLEWKTLTEISNFGFYAEKRADNEQSFSEIPNSFSPGQGTTLQPHSYSFIDTGIMLPGRYHYRLRQKDLDGNSRYFPSIAVDLTTTSVAEQAPHEFRLFQNYPNPFNPETEIKFSVEKAGVTTVRVYNTIGQEVSTLFDDIAEPGRYYRMKINGQNLASGIYFYKVQTGQRSDMRKMVLIK